MSRLVIVIVDEGDVFKDNRLLDRYGLGKTNPNALGNRFLKVPKYTGFVIWENAMLVSPNEE